MIVGFQSGAHFMFYDYMYFIGHLFPTLTSIYRDHQSFLGKSLLRRFAVFQDAQQCHCRQQILRTISSPHSAMLELEPLDELTGQFSHTCCG
jgi:hypothetical protein